MTKNVLFGYTIEEDEDSIGITFSGSMAKVVLRELATQSAGKGLFPRSLSLPFAVLGSEAINLFSQASASSQPQEQPNLAEIFGQGFDRTHDEFRNRLVEYQEVLERAQASESALANVEPEAKPEAPRANRKTSPTES